MATLFHPILSDAIQFQSTQSCQPNPLFPQPTKTTSLSLSRVLPDGTLGLIDYGMVGKLGLQERLLVAQVVVALAEGNANEVARLCEC
jgi:hypothetical protein